MSVLYGPLWLCCIIHYYYYYYYYFFKPSVAIPEGGKN